MVDEFDQITYSRWRRWTAAFVVNLALLAMIGLAVYILLVQSGTIAIPSIVASRTIRISAEHQGNIKALHVIETQEFKVGDVLFELEDTVLDTRIAEAEKAIKSYEQQIAEQESELARRLREFDPKMKIEAAEQLLREKQTALKNLAPLLEAANRRLAYQEDRLKRAEDLFSTGAITRARLDAYRLDVETERAGRDKILADQKVLETEIRGLENQIAAYKTMLADLTRSTAEQERALHDKLTQARSNLANLQSERALLTGRAKVSGSVAMRLKNEGEGVSVGEPVIEATSGDEIWVEAYFKPEDANAVRPGDQLVVRYGAQTFPVTVESIGLITKPFPLQRSAMILAPENLVVVKLVFVQPDQARQAGLRPGMQVATELTRREGLLARMGWKRKKPEAGR